MKIIPNLFLFHPDLLIVFTLSKEYIVYNCTRYRDKRHEIGIRYNDKDLKINWPIKNPIISNKDRNNLSLENIKTKLNDT